MHKPECTPASGRVLSRCQAEGGLLGTAGAERAISLLDPRKCVHFETGLPYFNY